MDVEDLIDWLNRDAEAFATVKLWARAYVEKHEEYETYGLAYNCAVELLLENGGGGG